MELSPKELKLQSSDTLEGGGVLLRWGSARWPGREQKIAYTAAQGRFSERKQSNRDSWRVTQLAIALPQRYDWPSSQQQEYNPRFSASVPAAVPAPCTCPIPAPAAAQVTGHSKGCSKDQHQWVLFFCFALWKDSVLQPVLSWSALKTATGETRGGWPQRRQGCPRGGNP